MHHALFSREIRQWTIVLCWIIAAVIAGIYIPLAGQPFKIENISDPSAESSVAKNLMQTQFPYGGSQIIVLYKSNNLHVHDMGFSNGVKKSLDGFKKLDFEHQVTSPYQNDRQISKNERVAYAVIATDMKSEKLANYMDEINKAIGDPKNLQVYIGGDPSYTADVNHLSEKNLVRGEMIALPICLIAMVFIFSGVMAACMTIAIGVINITVIIGILYVLGHHMDLSVFVLNIATMLGLGLSLDYTLLITYRFREEFSKYHDTLQAMKITLATAGKSVLFSGLIVLASIASLVFFPINILYSIGIGGIVVVIVTLLSSVTLLPASLALFHNYVTRQNPKLQKISYDGVYHYRWFRFATMVMKYPLTFMLPTIAFLLMLGYPFLEVKINSSDAKILPTWTESRKVMDQFNTSFDENELSPIYVVLTAKNKSMLSRDNIAAIYDYTQKLKKDSRVEHVSSLTTLMPNFNKQQYQQLYSRSPLPLNSDQKQALKSLTKGKYTIITIISKYTKDDKRNFALIETIRGQKVGNGIVKHIGGLSADIIDTMNIVYDLFIKVMIFICIVTYLLLFVLLRSIILPLKAIVMNMLSLSVCYGMLVYIFQEGHFAKLLHFQALGFTDLNLPILLFFVLFGLSMDYEVFLLSRIKEFYERTGDNAQSVALGIERSARIITSAALIMVIVTAAFVTADIVFIKAFGLGAALAIAIDATLIRLVLVPSTMRLLGNWNWYLPKWLNRILPDLHFDREDQPPPPKLPLKHPENV